MHSDFGLPRIQRRRELLKFLESHPRAVLVFVRSGRFTLVSAQDRRRERAIGTALWRCETPLMAAWVERRKMCFDPVPGVTVAPERLRAMADNLREFIASISETARIAELSLPSRPAA